jgi:MYXO-CTERM domain-containing protein
MTHGGVTMNKFIKATIGSTIIGLLVIMISFCYRFQLGINLKPVELRPLCQATMPPPLSISPVVLLLLGLLLLAVFGLRRKKL